MRKVIDRKATGQKIEDLMKEKGISIQEMADLMSISYQSVYGYVKGKKMPTTPNFYKISQILESDVEDLIVCTEEFRRECQRFAK